MHACTCFSFFISDAFYPFDQVGAIRSERAALEDRSAVAIQATYRGHRARRQVRDLLGITGTNSASACFMSVPFMYMGCYGSAQVSVMLSRETKSLANKMGFKGHRRDTKFQNMRSDEH